MSELEKNYNTNSTDVNYLKVGSKQYIIIGTAHVSQESADLVREVISREKPDCVCLELDEQRYKAISEKKKWESLNIRTVIKEKQLSTLMINLILAGYQKKIGDQLGVTPGQEFVQAAEVANSLNIPLELCDRNVRITIRRAWRSMTFFQKVKLFTSGLGGIFDSDEINEDTLRELRKKDVLTEILSELGTAMPVLKKVLIDERDAYISQKMKKTKGEKIVTVVGAGHLSGILSRLEENEEVDLEKLELIPKASNWIKIIGWSIPLLILGAITYIGLSKGLSAAGDNIFYWILANGIPSAVGAVIAIAHPFTILTAFIAAPFTSLTPVIGAGYVAAFAQAYFQPPLVKEFENVTTEIVKLRNWWSNKLLRILLVFLLTGLGSALGTYVGAYEIISNIF